MTIKKRRTRVWVNPAFQARLLVRVAVYFVIYVVVLSQVGFLFEAGRLLLNDHWDKPVAQVYVEYLSRLRPLLYGLLLITPYLIYDVLVFSHRIAGPLYRCRNVMQEMASGKPVPEFKPRERDLMPEFFATFNALIHEWNLRLGADRNAHPSAGRNGEAGGSVLVTGRVGASPDAADKSSLSAN